MSDETWNECERLRKILLRPAVLRSLSDEEKVEVIDRVILGFHSEAGTVEPRLIVPIGMVRAQQQAIDLIRKKQRERKVMENLRSQQQHAGETSGDDPLTAAASKEFQKALSLAMVAVLSRDERDAIHRRFYENQNFQQIADAQKISVSTAHQRLTAAVVKLHRQLRPFKELVGEAFRLPDSK